MPHHSVRKTNLLLLARDTKEIFKSNKLIALYPMLMAIQLQNSKKVRCYSFLIWVSQWHIKQLILNYRVT